VRKLFVADETSHSPNQRESWNSDFSYDSFYMRVRLCVSWVLRVFYHQYITNQCSAMLLDWRVTDSADTEACDHRSWMGEIWQQGIRTCGRIWVTEGKAFVLPVKLILWRACVFKSCCLLRATVGPLKQVRGGRRTDSKPKTCRNCQGGCREYLLAGELHQFHPKVRQSE